MFSHLRIHTGYSVVDSTVRLGDLFARAKDKNIVAVALTDVCNLFAAVKFYKQALSNGVKPIFGVELKIDTEFGVCDLVLLAENNQGYQNIVNLVSKAYQEADRFGSIPLIPKDWLKNINLANVICLNGGQNGELGKAILAKDDIRVEEIISESIAIFGRDNYIIEIHKLEYENEGLYNEKALELASKHNLIAVATNLTVFMESDDYDIHEIRACINEKTTILDESRKSKFTREQYLKSADEMYQTFSELPVLLENTLAIAKRCNVTFDLGKPCLPTVDIPDGLTEREYFSKLCYQGLDKRLAKILENRPVDKHEHIIKVYKDRLQREIDIICDMGFPGYFLIVEDFIRWSKENDIPVGPGRGSGAGSLVAYSLLITDIDPLPYGLLFERFLNPERVSMPDFDIDFCIQGRDRVIKYVEQKYGKQSVGQIITYGTMAAKGVVRDVVRVMGQSFGFGDRIAKLIPETPGTTFKKILHEGEPLYDEMQADEEVAEIVEKAQKLEGLPRSLGKHAAGIVISPTVISDFAPVYCEDKGGDIVTQFDKGDVEDVGLVKFDFLGLKNLTIIKNAIASINAKRSANETPLDISDIPLDDEKTFKLLQAGKTIGIFQLESQGMQQIVKDLGTSNFEEIIALVALYRPGPMENIPTFVDRKHGRKQTTYLHPLLEEVLRETYGIPVYQEQVMQMAQKLAGYTLGGADLLRRAMGKKKPEEMEQQRKIFKEGAAKYHNIEAGLADEIFDQMEAFAGYGFNKSHAAAYALIAYQTAWLKAHYPDEYMAALMSGDMGNTDQLVKFILDAKNMGITVLAPNVNKSVYDCIAASKGTILLGLGAIKGLGGEAIKSILNEREASGEFSSIFDLTRRVDLRKVNKKALEALCFAGAIKDISKNRATAFNSIEKAIKNAGYVNEMAAAGQNDLFGFTEQESDTDTELERECIVEEWNLRELLINEKKALGMYFSGHIIDDESHWRNHVSFSDLEKIQKPNMDGNSVRIIASMITPPARRKTKTGRVLYIINIDDEFDRADCLVGEDVFAAVKDNIQVDDVVVVEGKVSYDKQRECNKLSVDKVQPISQYIDENFSKVELNLRSQNVNPTNLKKVLDNLKKNIATTDIQRENVLEIKVSLDDVDAKFEYFRKPFSVYEFVNDISRLIAEGTTVSLSGI
ncbi:DNA polymerase III subunit alpha [Francisella philomiragia]|uniref:DNA polymerase III subunit alpha n=1 Tax=Francisella philomiragia subsp. philomiragia (strain ATCC 25017 / CCUG 19701 / FSC 153 / O\|nr:DNA polymerase III subunit alpha [Francisella philomiragia]AJI48039.1 DNA polymerase III, alpha subunit [Francisella philomiragia]AJI50203.1 DNA polymerase III, alpha subunit [Francisella philomiragia]MBK2021085.1 DNA polymerase III subunit alpha [Francisella philomiragia]MBK2031066.1 DNA polymerase III subunit alpha [Francisella philomiragia]MBK2264197.1 DNA polymerase III subunit alpha [Francisella philomiragia]